MSEIVEKNRFYESIKNILQSARENAYKQVNFIMVEAYWNKEKAPVMQEAREKTRDLLLPNMQTLSA